MKNKKFFLNKWSKIVFIAIFISNISVSLGSAAKDSEEPQMKTVRIPCIDGIYSMATFATEESQKEALQRGKEDSRNPFVNDVYQILHLVDDTNWTTATVTKISPNVYLCCKHTAIQLGDAITNFREKGKTSSFQLALKSGEKILSGLADCKIIPHKDVDLALLKLTFRDPDIIQEFLPIALQIECGFKGNGFVVSWLEELPATSSTLFKAQRVLSIHDFTKKETKGSFELESSLPGLLMEDDKAKELSKVLLRVYQGDQQALATVKTIAKEASFSFAGIGEVKPHRLMSILTQGASWAPLVVKQRGEFKIMGILTRGAAMPKFMHEAKGQDLIAIFEKTKEILWLNSFLDLTNHADWIAANIVKLQNLKD